jgi:hypothetical protein
MIPRYRALLSNDDYNLEANCLIEESYLGRIVASRPILPNLMNHLTAHAKDHWPEDCH